MDPSAGGTRGCGGDLGEENPLPMCVGQRLKQRGRGEKSPIKMAMWQCAWEPLLASLLVRLMWWQGVPG